MTQPAKVLAPADLRDLLRCARRSRHPNRNSLIILLSFKVGLRACEIAGLSWPMVIAANGKVANSITVAGTIAKNGRGRRIPTHPDLKRALANHHRDQGYCSTGPVIRSQRGGHFTARGIVNWFATAYAEAGLEGCSSHSGRRTFITTAARLVSKTGGSLRDVQELAGHRALSTTERYIECDRDAQRKLVKML